MIEMFKTHPRFVIGAVIVHVLFIGLFVFSFNFSDEKKQVQVPKSVDVAAVSNKQVDRELKQLERQDKAEKRKLERERKKEEKRLKDVRDKRKKEQQKAKREKEKAKQEKKDLAALEKKKKEKEKDIERLAVEKEKQQAEIKKLQDEKDIAEKEKRDREAKERFEKENAQQVADANAKEKIETDNKNKEIGLKEKYKYLIIKKINDNWTIPSNLKKGISCVVYIRLSPSGDVIDVKISTSSGNPTYDESVIAAVKKARIFPLPPREANLFDEFRELELTIYPEGDKV